MKVSIRVKMVAIGALISALTTGVALSLSTILFRKSSHETLLSTINEWMTILEDDYTNDNSGPTNRSTINIIYDYIKPIYTSGGDDPETFETWKDKYNYYFNKYKWAYPINGFGMTLQTEEEMATRAAYKDLTYKMIDVKIGTSAKVVYLCCFDEVKNRLIYLCDDSSNIPGGKQEYYLPGSYLSDVIDRPTKSSSFFDFNINGTTAKVLPIVFDSSNADEVTYLVIEYSFAGIDANADNIFRIELLTLGLSFVALMVMFFILSHLLVSRNVVKLSKASNKFTQNLKDNTELEVEDPCIKSHDEIRDLSNSFIALEQEIINYITLIKQETSEKEKMNAELAVASKIQLEALPDSSYMDNNFKLKAFIKTAKEVGGDFYDYFYLDKNKLLITVCDVSGKGIPAALFMMKGKQLIKYHVQSGSSIKEAVYKANNELTKNNDENLFITAFVGVIDLEKQEIYYVNAGHEKPYIISNGEAIKLDGISNFVLGGEEDYEYVMEKHSLKPGDRIFLFTDGLNEAINDKEEEFSYSRIEEVLKDNINSSIEETVNNMNIAHDNFVGDREVFDDVTILFVEVNQKELSLFYSGRDMTIIEKMVDSFEKTFSYLPLKIKSEVGIILDEMINNIISYAKNDELTLSVDFKIKDDSLYIVLMDNGEKFNPLGSEDKYIEEYSEDIELGGFGIGLMKTLSNEQKYEYKNKKNILTIIKKI